MSAKELGEKLGIPTTKASQVLHTLKDKLDKSGDRGDYRYAVIV